MTSRTILFSVIALCLLFTACKDDGMTDGGGVAVESSTFSFDITYNETDIAEIFPGIKTIPSSFLADWEENDVVRIDTLNGIETFQSANNGAYWISALENEGISTIKAIDYSVADSMSLLFLITDEDISTPKRFTIATGNLLEEIIGGLFGGGSEITLPPGVAIPLFDTNDDAASFPFSTFFGVFEFAESDFIEIESYDAATNTISGSFELNYSLGEGVTVPSGIDGSNFLKITNGIFRDVTIAQIQ